MQDSCKSDSIHEITIQFRFELSEYSIFGKKPFAPILQMLQDARKGLVFPMSAIMQVHNSLTSLSAQQDRFTLFLEFLKILNTLANADRYRTLATDCYANVAVKKESWRVQKVLDFMDNHYMDDIKLKALAEIACMSEASFSRFFKQKTGRNISEYIIDMRLGHATRLLVDTDKSVADISFQCGFNNLSNFNRIFKRKKQCSPTEFRQYYYKTRKII